jgi:glycosyltransferase involved in cell wall biosynthesis
MRILLVSLHFGEEGSGGSRRSFLWAKGLRAAGHKVHVVSPYANLENEDDIVIPHRHQKQRDMNSPEIPASLFERGIKRHLRLWLLWPEPEILWYKTVEAAVVEKIDSVDWVFTTSPPESSHRIGGDLAMNLKAKWCAEFRDSWTENSHRPHVKGIRAKIEKQLAKRWLKTVDAVTAVDKYIIKEARALAPHANYCEIGHFSEPFSGTPASLSEDDINIVHAGGFSRSDRRRKLKDLLSLIAPTMRQRSELRLHLFGPLSFEEAEQLKATDLKITYHGWVSLSRSRELQAGADALLLFTPSSGSQALPGKYSEYCNLRKPIIFIGPDHIKQMAHRHSEFRSVSDLLVLSKNEITPPETFATVSHATQRLIKLLDLASEVENA